MLAQLVYIQVEYIGSPKFLPLSAIKKLPRVNTRLQNRRKFAQSGHPGAKLRPSCVTCQHFFHVSIAEGLHT
jgi:hypothetical protein